MSDASPANSPEQVVFNMTSFGRITGPRAGEYAKKNQPRVEIHEYPSGKKVTKDFLAEDLDFFDKKKRRIRVFNESSLKRLFHESQMAYPKESSRWTNSAHNGRFGPSRHMPRQERFSSCFTKAAPATFSITAFGNLPGQEWRRQIFDCQ